LRTGEIFSRQFQGDFLLPKIDRLWQPVLLLLTLLATVRCLNASPATFVTALPVAQNQILTRFNWNPRLGSQAYVSNMFPIDLAYGVNARWTLFTTLNLGHTSMNVSTEGPPKHAATSGWGDTLAFARYTLYSRDTSAATFRIAPVAGAYLPSGSNAQQMAHRILPAPLQTGSGAVAPYGGIAMGFNTRRYGVAADTTFRHNPITHSGISPGDAFRADAQGEIRLHPFHLPKDGLPNELWLSVEENYRHISLSHQDGAVLGQSGTETFDQDAVFEYATLHYEVGLGAQVPLMQLLGPGAVRQRYELLFFTEYYLSGFSRRTP
jgi:hypothetical protein